MQVYRIKNAVRAVISEENGSRLTELPPGAVFFLTNLEPDSNGMIEGTSDHLTVLLFRNDLEERAELMNIRISPASVRVTPELSQR
jgi:hypothetical protein